jgi:2-polyprenyl-3-methyl-5-hydroxy-6-metoxy-1,4-benzoquinol methylase
VKTAEAADAAACAHRAWTPLHDAVPDFEHRSARPVSFVRCSACGLVRQDPVASVASLREGYPEDYRAHLSGDHPSALGRAVAGLKSVQAGMLLAKLRRFLPAKDAPILELGCGSGHLLRRLRAEGFTNLHGVDRNPDLREALRSAGIGFTACDLDEGLAVTGRYHTIVMIYLLEHLADPEGVLRAAAKLLVPGGQLLVLTPNAASVGHRLFGRYWAGLHAPRHASLQAPSTMRAAARALGFEEVRVTFPTDPGSWALSAQNLVESHRKAAAPPFGTRAYALALLPFVYPLALAESVSGRGSSMLVRLAGAGAGVEAGAGSKPERDAIV